MSWKRSLHLAVLLPALAAGSLGGASQAAAAGVTDPTVSATVAGAAAASVGVGDVIDVTRTAPIAASGQTGQALEATWDPAQTALGAGGVTAPEGWNLEYTDDGSTWSATAPSDPTTVRGVRTDGLIDSQGLSSGLQVSSATASGTLKPARSAFAGSSGGDGWDVFFTATKALNVWHHNPSRYNLDCHLLSTGASCGAVYALDGYQTSNASSGTAVGDKVYSTVGQNSSTSVGVLCTDTSTTPFTSCGYTPLVTGTANYGVLGSQSRSGSRVYVPLATGGGQLACFDTATSAACAGQPYTLTGLVQAPTVPAFSVAVGGNVFVTANKIWCFDGATGASCTGSWPAGAFSGYVHAAVPSRDTAGNLTGVCMIKPAGSCFDLTGASSTMPAALASLLSAKPVGGFAQIGYGQYGFTGTRQYWFTGTGSYSEAVPAACWDWVTGAACAGFQTTTAIGSLRYAIVVDPFDDTCLWSNGDNGQIQPFDGTTGEAGCRPSDPTVTLPYTAAVPRLSCTEAGRVRGWRSITVTAPQGPAPSSLRVTMRTEAGAAIPGYTDVTPDSSGVVDLSALSVATSGTRPSFEVKTVGGTDAQAQAITGTIRYSSDPPQLCVALTVVRQCPSAAAVYPTSTVPVSDLTLGGLATATVGGSSTTTPLQVDVTRAGMTGCVGDVAGKVSRTDGATSTPLGNAIVRLVGPGGAVLATTTSAADGSYAVRNLAAAGYTVQVGDASQAVSPTAGGTARADFDIAVQTPTARPVQVVTPFDTAATASIDATADPATAIDASTLQLQDGSGWVATLVMAGEGSWDVVSGRLRFTPVPGFVGRSTDVTYRVSDGFGAVATSTARAEVADAPAFSLGSTPVSIVSGSEGRVPVGGIPAGARATVPPTVVGASAVTIAGGVVSVIPTAGFSGIISVPVTVSFGARTVVNEVLVRVHPVAVPGGTSTLGRHRSVIRWTPSPTSSVVRYAVYVDGRRVCSTAATRCSVKRLIGPRADVRVRAVGGSELTSAPTVAPYVASGCSQIENVHFGTGSATLRATAKKRLRHIAARIRSNGFTHVCLVGHTDSRGRAAYNKDLSDRRVSTVGHRLTKRLKHIEVSLRYRGERAPASRNDTKRGRATNRRVSIGIR
jgi:outer membrane protein OmpA-like peptidoglycan-associated protein